MKARFAGKGIRVGDEIVKRGGRWVLATSVSAASSSDEREYQKGLGDGRRYQSDKAVYGKGLADKWQAQEEFDRYWKYGEE